MSRGSLAVRGVVGLLVGAVVGPWLVPPGSAGGGRDDPADPLPPVPRSVWLYSADASALPAAESRLDEVLDHVAARNHRRLVDMEVRVHVVPRDRDITELDLWRDLRGRQVPDSDAADPYPEARTYDEVRGLGPPICEPGPLHIGIGEEQVRRFTDGTHLSPHPDDLGRNLVHELGHAVECSLTSDQHEALTGAYSAARRRFPDGIVGVHPAYTVSNPREYFAEGTVAWFDTGGDGTYRRSWLSEHDRALHDLLAGVFAAPPSVPRCDGQRATAVLTGGAFTGTPGADVIAGSPGRDVVNGGGGADVICGGGGPDLLYGGYGPDRLHGGQDDDSLVGGPDDLCSQDPHDPVLRCDASPHTQPDPTGPPGSSGPSV